MKTHVIAVKIESLHHMSIGQVQVALDDFDARYRLNTCNDCRIWATLVKPQKKKKVSKK